MPPWVISSDLCITLATYMLEVFVIFLKLELKLFLLKEKTPILVTAFFFFPFILDHPEKREKPNYL